MSERSTTADVQAEAGSMGRTPGQAGSERRPLTGQDRHAKARHEESSAIDGEQLATGLGWFSVGLGLAQIVAPSNMSQLMGVGEHRFLLRLLGMREMATGVGILSARKPAGWLWARVAGDAMDLALLGAAFLLPGTKRDRLVATTAFTAGVTALDVLNAQQLSRQRGASTAGHAVRVKKSVTINRSPEELYRFWHDFENLPRFMKHLESVKVTGQGRSHWVARAPAGGSVEWDAEITADQPNQRIEWRSLEGSDVDHAGSVRFESASGGRGTVVRVEIEYTPPGGLLGSWAARLFGEEPDQQVSEDLRRFKQVMEAGEIITTEGQPAGRERSTSWKYDRTVRS